jgi:hypothetical protein
LSKVCRACKRTLSSEHFGRYAQSADGLRPDCRECRKTQSADYYARHRPTIRSKAKARYRANPEPTRIQKARWYSQNREHAIAIEAARQRTPTGKAKKLEYVKNARRRDPRPFMARLAVARALKSRALVKHACACGSRKVEAHHHRGYSKERELDVVWLCRRCHNVEHGHTPSRSAS